MVLSREKDEGADHWANMLEAARGVAGPRGVFFLFNFWRIGDIRSLKGSG
jgi:hypothetical protein